MHIIIEKGRNRTGITQHDTSSAINTCVRMEGRSLYYYYCYC